MDRRGSPPEPQGQDDRQWLVLLGFRRDESPKRADPVATPEREWSDEYDCEVWRPILDWTINDVIAEHHRANVPINPLYLKGAERVGCWPCIHAGKAELRLIGETDPARIERIAAIEADIGQTMFALEQSRKGGKERKLIPTGIHAVVTWAMTERGGRQLTMIPEASGCHRWAVCERPIQERGEPIGGLRGDPVGGSGQDGATRDTVSALSSGTYLPAAERPETP